MHFIVHKSLKEHHKSQFSFKKIRNVHFDFMLTLMSQVSRSGVQADRGTMDGLNLWSWAFGFSSSVSAGNKDLVSNFLSCSHSIPSFPIDLDLYPIFFTSCPFFLSHPSHPTNCSLTLSLWAGAEVRVLSGQSPGAFSAEEGHRGCAHCSLPLLVCPLHWL